MRFRAFWTTINEGKNYYYQVPSDKEKRLFDFYSLELLIKLAKASPQDKKDPHHIFRTLEDDSSELTSLLDAEDKLLPVLKQDILAAMLVSMCCEMRHADSSGGIGFLSEKNQPIFKDFIVNLKIFKALEGGHEDFKIDTKRHRMNNGATPGFTDAAADHVASNLIKDYAIGKQKAEEILAKDVVYCLKSNIAPDKIHITPQANNSSVTFTFPYYFVKLKPALPASKEKSSQQSTNEIDFLKDLDDLIHVYYVVKDTNSIQPPYTSFELKPQYQNKAWNFPLIFGDMQLAVYKLQKSIVFNLKYTPTGNELNLLKRLYAKLLKVDSQNTIEI